MNTRSKMSKVLAYTLLLMGCSSLAICPKSYSYFMDEDPEALKYHSEVVDLYSEAPLNLLRAGSLEAKLELNFTNNNKVTADAEDKYEIKLPSYCSFTGEKSTAGVANITSGTQIGTITFPSGSTTRGLSSVNITCQVSGMKTGENLATEVKIKETITKSSTGSGSFVYMKLKYSDTYLNYVSQIPPEAADNITIPNTDNPYKRFKEWIYAYAAKTSYETEIKHYIDTKFKDEMDFNNRITNLELYANDFFNLPGIEIKKDGTNYTYKVVDNFIGYARTAYQNRVTQNNAVFFFIDSKNSNTQDTAFELYLEKYIYPDPTEAELLTKAKEYFKNNGGISTFIAGTPITGINKGTEDTQYYVNKTRLYDILNPPIIEDKVKIEIENSTTLDMSRTLRSALQSEKFKNAISQQFITNLLDRFFYPNVSNEIAELYASIMTGASDREGINEDLEYYNKTARITEAKIFTDYFIIKEPTFNHYLMFKVWSEDAKTNNVRVDAIELPENMEIVFNDTATELTVTITYHLTSETQTKYDEVIAKLAEFFELSTLVATNMEGDIREYKISKPPVTQNASLQESNILSMDIPMLSLPGQTVEMTPQEKPKETEISEEEKAEKVEINAPPKDASDDEDLKQPEEKPTEDKPMETPPLTEPPKDDQLEETEKEEATPEKDAPPEEKEESKEVDNVDTDGSATIVDDSQTENIDEPMTTSADGPEPPTT